VSILDLISRCRGEVSFVCFFFSFLFFDLTKDDIGVAHSVSYSKTHPSGSLADNTNIDVIGGCEKQEFFLKNKEKKKKRKKEKEWNAAGKKQEKPFRSIDVLVLVVQKSWNPAIGVRVSA
jgi:hypothetical protein